MGIFSNPKLPYFVRIVQLVFSLGFLILICYGGVHRGWWRNINGALAVGVITSIFTFAVTIYTIIIYHRNNPFAGHGKAFTFARLGVEALVFLLWIASATLMLRPKSGCHPRNPPGNPDACFNGNHDSHPKKWADQPLITWDIAIGFSFVEIVSFVLSAALVFMENRLTQASGGA